MTARSRSYWNGLLLTGYQITQADWVDLADSFLTLLDDELIIEVALAQLDTDIEVKTGVAKFPIPENMTLKSAFARVDIAPVGANIVYDLNIGGVSIWSSKLNIPAGALTSLGAGDPVFSTTDVNADDPATVDCDQIGATTSGQNPVLVLKYVKR